MTPAGLSRTKKDFVCLIVRIAILQDEAARATRAHVARECLAKRSGQHRKVFMIYTAVLCYKIAVQ